MRGVLLLTLLLAGSSADALQLRLADQAAKQGRRVMPKEEGAKLAVDSLLVRRSNLDPVTTSELTKLFAAKDRGNLAYKTEQGVVLRVESEALGQVAYFRGGRLVGSHETYWQGFARKFKETVGNERGRIRFGTGELRRFAPALESGLTRRLQTSISEVLKQGEIVGLRKRAYGANFLDEKYFSKHLGARVLRNFKNGVRMLTDGSKVISDVDLAFVTKNKQILSEYYSLEVGKRINRSYGHDVVLHGDNYWGARKGVSKALEIERRRTEIIYVFDKNGFKDKGPYWSMVRKYMAFE